MESPVKHKLDYSDYLVAPDDCNCYEILEGDLYVTPPPTPRHQRVSRRLQRQLEDYFHARSLGEVFNAPVALILTQQDIVEPDLLVVADPEQVSDRGIEGPPLLVVEILSPSTRHKDRGVKARRYAELGVRHYWIVDPEANRVECLRLDSGTYELVTAVGGHSSLAHPDWDDLVIDLEIVFR